MKKTSFILLAVMVIFPGLLYGQVPAVLNGVSRTDDGKLVLSLRNGTVMTALDMAPYVIIGKMYGQPARRTPHHFRQRPVL